MTDQPRTWNASNTQAGSPQPRPMSSLAAPYSEEAEEAVIGSVLVNPDAFLTVASFLKADDFYLIRHGYIWQALERLNNRSEPIDYLTLMQELKDMGWLDDIGGPGYITRLVNNTPTSMHAEFYGRIVERTSLRRRLMVTADEIKAIALDETLDIDTVINNSETRLFSVTDRQLKREFVPMHDAVNEYFDRIEHLMQNQIESFGVPSGFKKLDELLGGFQRSDLLIFAGRPGMGKCISAGTLVHTEHGLVSIEDLQPQDAPGLSDDEGGVYYPLEIGVQTPDGLRYTSHFYDSGIKPTIRITTRAGYSLTGTYVHPVLILAPSGEKAWKTLDEICAGDFVAVQRHQPIWGNTNNLPSFSFEYNPNLRSTKVPELPSEVTPELAYFLGLLVGDGCMTGKNSVKISSSDPEIIDVFYAWANKLGLYARHNKAYDHHIGSIVLQSWLSHLGIKGYSHEKEIPQVILQASQESVRAFLQGLFDTDGHAEVQRGYIQFVTTSEQLARQVHLLLLQFGIVSKLTFKTNAYRGAWLIRITGDAARSFYDNIGFRLQRKQQRRELLPERSNSNLDIVPYLPSTTARFKKHLNYGRYFRGDRSPSYEMLTAIAEYAPEVQDLLEPQFYWDEIVSVEDAGMQHCYDLVVPDGHAFVANGIVNHNTSFLLSAATNAARLGGRIAIFTMEMGADQIVQRIVAMETGINTQKLRLGQLTQMEYARFVEAAGRIARFPIFIDDTPALTPIQMRTKCRRLQHEHGIDMVIVDYMQLMNAGGTYQNNRVQEISYISRALKELARELNVPIFSAAQLSRAVEQRQDKRPVLSDLRESGSIEQDSDIVIFLYRDVIYNEATEFPNQADLIVAKHRNGPTGTVSLYFDNTLTKFMDGAVRRVDLGEY